MTEKILVADDSPTIQKVVGITLANTDYELDSAQDESELFSKLSESNFDLVLLDFNLSDGITGYDLASKVKESNSDIIILAMVGTFDTVDEGMMEEAGIVDKIIKPFESSKFIQKIKASLSDKAPKGSSDNQSSASSEGMTLDTSDFEDSNESLQKETDSFPEDDHFGDELSGDEWTMSGSQNFDDEELDSDIDIDSDLTGSDSLAKEMEGWGMSVPSVIHSDGSDEQVFPEQINRAEKTHDMSLLQEGASLLADHAGDEGEDEDREEDNLIPEDDDLDYPTMGNDREQAPSSQLVSLDQLDAPDDIDDEMLDDTDPQIIIERPIDSPDLINELEDEVSSDDFWAADETYDLEESEDDDDGIRLEAGIEESELGFEVESHVPIESTQVELEQRDEATSPVINALNSLNENNSEIGPKLESGSKDFNIDEIVERLKRELRPFIKEVVAEVLDGASKEAAERVAWEVIPDLAENLIKSEVKEISKKVQSKHSLS